MGTDCIRVVTVTGPDSSCVKLLGMASRMRNDLRLQGKELDAEREESRTLRSKLNAKEQALTKISAENTAMSDRLLRCEGMSWALHLDRFPRVSPCRAAVS